MVLFCIHACDIHQLSVFPTSPVLSFSHISIFPSQNHHHLLLFAILSVRYNSLHHTPVLFKSINYSLPCLLPTPSPPNSSPTPKPRIRAIDRVRNPGAVGAASNSHNSHRRRPRLNRSNRLRPSKRRTKRLNHRPHPGPCSRLSTSGRIRPRWTGR